MKKAFFIAAAMTLSAAFAAPFVYPADWSADSAQTPQMGGTIRVTNLSDFKTLNPFISAESPNLTNLGGGLLGSDAGALLAYDPAKKNYIPYMAESYTLSPDKKTFTLKIRKGMKWSDGKDITADDWVTSATIASDEKVGSNSYSSFFPNDKQVKVSKLDDYTLKVVWPFPNVTALDFLTGFDPEPTHVFMPVYKSKGADGIKAMWTVSTPANQIVSWGPFRLKQYVPGERAVLEKNPYFGEWNKDSAGRALPYLGAMNISFVKDANASLAQFLASNTDVYQPTDRDKLAQVKAAIDGNKINATLVANASPVASSDFITFNMDDGSSFKGKLFRNPKFRQAMSMLANRAAMVDLALGGLGQPAYSGTYAVFKDWIPEGLDKYKYNPEEAAKLLAEIGFKKGPDGILRDAKGNKLEFTLVTNAENNRRQQLAKIFADDAKKVGVQVDVSPLAFNQVVAMFDATPGFKPRKFDAILLGLTGGSLSFPTGGVNVIPCTNLPEGGNLHQFNQTNKCIFPWETEAVNLYNKGVQEFDLAKRKAISAQMQRSDVENQPYLYLESPNAHYAWMNTIHGQLPRDIMSSLFASSTYGPRFISLTYIK